MSKQCLPLSCMHQFLVVNSILLFEKILFLQIIWKFSTDYCLQLCYECSCPAASISLTSTHFSIFFFIMSCIYNRSPLLRISWQAFLRQFWHRFPTWQKTTTSPIRSWISKVSNFGLKSCDGISSISNTAKRPIYSVLDIYETSSLVFLCQKAFNLMWKRLAKCRNSVMPFLSYCHFCILNYLLLCCNFA